MADLLRTKLHIPRPSDRLVLRPRLTDRLTAGLDSRLTLIAAPAGFGKTSLLAEWIPESPRCVTWLSLEEADNDPTRFWTYVINSLRQVNRGLGAGALDLLQSPQPPPMPSILGSLINDIAGFHEPFAAVLDDYHEVDAQAIHNGLGFLLDHLPSNLHLILASRTDPPLRLARLRAASALTELRAGDLRFTAEEAADFLGRVMGLRLSAEQVALLESRTEGWIAGLQIAALSMQSQEDVSGFIRSFSGSHRHILGYLAEEVLDRRPEGTLEFLMRTSILDRMCAPLCDAVTGLTDSQAILERLDQANLFISPLDDQREWYRYHHLFADVLRARLQRSRPGMAAELHRRASVWHAQSGSVQEAISHAMASGDHGHAAILVEGEAGEMLRRGACNTLSAWLDALPEATLRARPQLCLARAWTCQWGAAINLSGAEQWSGLAVQVARTEGSYTDALGGEAAAVQAMVAATRSDVARTRELCRQALKDLPADSPWRSAVAFTLGTAHLESSDVAAAAQAFEQALELSANSRMRYIQTAGGSFLGDIRVLQGRLGRALEMYQQVLSWAGPGTPYKGAAMAHGGLASILCEQDQLDAALDHVRLGTGMLEHVGGAWAAFVLDRVVSRVQQIRGEEKNALSTLDRSFQAARAAQITLVVRQVAAQRASLQLAQGNLPAAEAWAVESRLGPEDAGVGEPGWREFEYLTFARVRNAQGKHAEAGALLDRLLAAAEAQGRAGSAIAILIGKSLVLQAQGSPDSALRHLEHALTLAEPEGYLRIFADEGEPMRELLAELQTHTRRHAGEADAAVSRRLAYLGRLMDLFPQPITVPGQGLPDQAEPLTDRELEILRLMSSGLSNQEIAVVLVVALSTVKSHINHLYGKLGAQRRTQAIAVARERGLLAD